MGPLKGIKILEFAGIGPGPFCGMLLADLGAEIIKISRPESKGNGSKYDLNDRSKFSITLDLKNDESINELKKLIGQVDAVFEGFRPGVMEKLGLGPNDLLSINEKLVYGRMTGWGQEGVFSDMAGHDLNYLSITGALNAIGRKDERPPVPLNLIADYGGGGMLLAVGMLSALIHSQKTGKGQVVDAAMIDGTSMLMSLFYSFYGSGVWTNERESNLLDGAAHFYDTYECKDGKYVSIGSIEPQFYALLCEKAELSIDDFGDQMKRDTWQNKKQLIKDVFLTKTREEWCDLMEGSDVCFAPVLDMSEAPMHPHNIARQTFIEIEGVTQPAPAPRFDRTQNEITLPPAIAGEHSKEILESLGIDSDEYDRLISSGSVV